MLEAHTPVFRSLTFILNTVWIFMMIRDACCFTISFISFGVPCETFLKDLLNRRTWSLASSRLVLIEYTKIWLVIRTSENTVNQCLFTLYVISQIGVTASAWVAVKTIYVAPVLIVFTFAAAFLSGYTLF